MTMWQSVGRIGIALVYGAIGALLGFLLGYFFMRPLLLAGFSPDFVKSAGYWAPHFFTGLTGLLAALGFLKSEPGPK
ncbi:MAG: hypothetical protein LCH39_04840 [Proteobacteria bacterium]|nr:hypothetical protein [Pseudomonadota bacterium]